MIHNAPRAEKTATTRIAIDSSRPCSIVAVSESTSAARGISTGVVDMLRKGRVGGWVAMRCKCLLLQEGEGGYLLLASGERVLGSRDYVCMYVCVCVYWVLHLYSIYSECACIHTC